jgi:hypothetical protein
MLGLFPPNGLVREGLERLAPMILLTGVVGRADFDFVLFGLTAAGDLGRAASTVCTLFSNAVTFAARICNREKTLFTTR